MQLAEQLDDKFAVGDGCWLWSAYTATASCVVTASPTTLTGSRTSCSSGRSRLALSLTISAETGHASDLTISNQSHTGRTCFVAKASRHRTRERRTAPRATRSMPSGAGSAPAVHAVTRGSA
jgi:hypothetical protein